MAGQFAERSPQQKKYSEKIFFKKPSDTHVNYESPLLPKSNASQEQAAKAYQGKLLPPNTIIHENLSWPRNL